MNSQKNKVVSIVLGTYNRLFFLKLTIQSVRKELELLNQPCEIIVIDGGSTDGTIKWLIEQKDIISIIQHNRGFWKGKEIDRRSWGYFMNLGFKISQGKFVCMVSDDCLFVPGSLKNGLIQFNDLLEKGNKIGGIAFFWREYPFVESENYWVGRTFEKVFINHGLFLRQALEDVDYIDEDSFRFYHADGDLSLKIIEKGYQILPADNSYIEHYSHANTQLRTTNFSKQKADFLKFKEKWFHLAVHERIKIGDAIFKNFADSKHTIDYYRNLSSNNRVRDFFKKVIKKLISLVKNREYYEKNFLNDKFIKKISIQNKKNSFSISNLVLRFDNDKVHGDEHFYKSELKEIREETLSTYDDIYKGYSERILIHVPEDQHSPAGYSYFNNLYQTLNFMGVPVEKFQGSDDLDIKFKFFKPTLFLSSDHESYLSQFDWTSILKYKEKNQFKVGLTASLEEYGNSPLYSRLEDYSNGKVDFFYSFRTSEYIEFRKEYDLFKTFNYRIFNIEFACNPLYHYPVENNKKEFDFVFLASNNPDKVKRVSKYFSKIVSQYNGVIAGPWWPFTKNFRINPEQDRVIYSMAKVGLNLSIPEQIQFPCELNERTYILAACGILQLIDNPCILSKRFSPESLFHSKDASEYFKNFMFILKNYPDLTHIRTNAFKEAYKKHTTFHRMEKFLLELRSH